tara:strand:- start:10341 stop:10823 length:483 start_codon:yes stop_codon:yes gene_type:complete
MVDGEIDPRSVDAMENFKKYSEEAQKNMKALQTQMDKFTNSMSMTKSHSTDLRESLRQMGGIEPFKQMEESIKGVQEGLEKTMTARQAPQAPSAERRLPTKAGAQEEQNNVTVNLKIDVSGITDRTDKRALAKEISAMVTKELRSKIGGPLSSSGFSRSG